MTNINIETLTATTRGSRPANWSHFVSLYSVDTSSRTAPAFGRHTAH